MIGWHGSDRKKASQRAWRGLKDYPEQRLPTLRACMP